MDTLADFVSQKDRIEALEKQVTILEGRSAYSKADLELKEIFFEGAKKELANKITSLKKRLKSQRGLKNKAIEALVIARANRLRAVNILLKLCGSGKLDLSTKEISDLCFITEKSVIDAKSRIKQKGLL